MNKRIKKKIHARCGCRTYRKFKSFREGRLNVSVVRAVGAWRSVAGVDGDKLYTIKPVKIDARGAMLFGYVDGIFYNGAVIGLEEL